MGTGKWRRAAVVVAKEAGRRRGEQIRQCEWGSCWNGLIFGAPYMVGPTPFVPFFPHAQRSSAGESLMG
jgi:hypothetical protein